MKKCEGLREITSVMIMKNFQSFAQNGNFLAVIKLLVKSYRLHTMESVSQVQNLDRVVCVLFRANALGNSMNPCVLPLPRYGHIVVGQTNSSILVRQPV